MDDPNIIKTLVLPVENISHYLLKLKKKKLATQKQMEKALFPQGQDLKACPTQL